MSYSRENNTRKTLLRDMLLGISIIFFPDMRYLHKDCLSIARSQYNLQCPVTMFKNIDPTLFL